ncbi:MAG: hypothetical protein JW856_06135 [Dehalococcoidales bacterium]|nr:hypothetical protein [Dehalococcoidales bacterium]
MMTKEGGLDSLPSPRMTKKGMGHYGVGFPSTRFFVVPIESGLLAMDEKWRY